MPAHRSSSSSTTRRSWRADWIVDLGPGADGGRIVFAGTLDAHVAARFTLTGQHLAAYVGA